MLIGIGINIAAPAIIRASSGGNPAYTAETNAFLARAETAHGSALDSTYTDAVDQMIRDLQADTSWDDCTAVFNFSAPSQAVALLDWKQDRTATLSGTATFTANSGFDFSSNTSHINAGVGVPAQDDAHVSVRLGTYTWLSQRAIIQTINGLSTSLRTPVTTNTGNVTARLNTNSELAIDNAAFVDLTGHTFLIRNNSADFVVQNGDGTATDTITRFSVAPGDDLILFGGQTAVALGLDNTPYHGGTIGTAPTTPATIDTAFATFRTTMGST